MVLVATGVVARIAARVWRGEMSFLTEGYTFYLSLADTFLQGDGLCYAPGDSCAIRLPLYPLFLAALKWAGWLYPGAVVAQAFMGGATAWAAWSIGRSLFGPAVALAAAAAVALNPYAVMHDTALQDTVLVNLLVLVTVAALLRAAKSPGMLGWLVAGGALALALLTSARIALFIPFAVGWAMAVTPGAGLARLRQGLLVALPVVIAGGGWIGRNAAVAGAPVLTTESGLSLFIGNSPLTFVSFPDESVDLTIDALETLPAVVQRRIQDVDGQEVAQDRVLRDLAVAHIAAHPDRVIIGMARKLWVVVSAQFSPARGPLEQWGYRLVFLPLHLLALAGAWRVRRRWHEHALPLLLVVSFGLTTAVFWAHTSHKSLVDPVIFIYAAAGRAAITAARTR